MNFKLEWKNDLQSEFISINKDQQKLDSQKRSFGHPKVNEEKLKITSNPDEESDTIISYTNNYINSEGN